MKRLLPTLIGLLLCLCSFAALCGCDTPSGQEGAVISTAETASAPAEPQPVSTVLTLDGADELPLYGLEDTLYVEAEALCEGLGLTWAEAEGTLTLTLPEGSLTLAEGSDAAAEAGTGNCLTLEAPVYRGEEGWYVPVSLLEQQWGRTLVADGETDRLQCLQVEAGPSLRFNSAVLEEPCGLCNGVPVLTDSQLAALWGGEARWGEAADGTPTLTLLVWDHTLTFRQGALEADLDGSPLALPVPAWQAGYRWYLPVTAAAQGLGCTVLQEPETGALTLLRLEEGPYCWLAGKGIGNVRQMDQTLYGDLETLADALGGTLTQEDAALVLEALGHSLRLRPLETDASLDGEALALQSPVLVSETGFLAPLDDTARALGLEKREEEGGLVYTRLEPCETRIWMEGQQAPTHTLPEGGLYVCLADAALAAGGSFAPEGNEAILMAWGREVRLTGGSAVLLAEGETWELTLPVLAEGSRWYASAPDLLPLLGLTELIDPELDQRYYTHIVKNDAIPTGCRVPVFMYHAVGDVFWGIPELFVSPSMLDKQLAALVEAGYTAITFEDLERVDEIENPVLLTFDDGYLDAYTELLPLLKKYNLKATVFVIIDKIGEAYWADEEQIREMSESGFISIQSHTVSHELLGYLNESQLRHEYKDSMLALARITGKQPFVLCYPSGNSSAYSRSVAAEYYEFGLSMGGPCYVTGADPFLIYRYYVPRNMGVETFLNRLTGQ